MGQVGCVRSQSAARAATRTLRTQRLRPGVVQVVVDATLLARPADLQGIVVGRRQVPEHVHRVRAVILTEREQVDRRGVQVAVSGRLACRVTCLQRAASSI